jgi:hypothetical protein
MSASDHQGSIDALDARPLTEEPNEVEEPNEAIAGSASSLVVGTSSTFAR